ncbi:MAG: serine/threonine protein kinase, partial [bacterium]|nr:serine/threonine protein kinase [bacterium]
MKADSAAGEATSPLRTVQVKPLPAEDLEDSISSACGFPVGASQTPTENLDGGTKREGPPFRDGLDQGRFSPGTILAGRYRIVAALGRGGMGEVFRAEDLKLRQEVALKFLPPGLAGDPSLLARFHNEVRVARKVSHRNVCRVHDIIEAEGQHFVSMEYIDGENLASLLKRIGRLQADKAIEVSRQICAGLGAVHEQGILHRDLKPANIMIDGRGRARPTDFGLATLLTDSTRGEFAGTPAYMSPEQAVGEEHVGPAGDLYSLGTVLFELLTGRLPFSGRDV